MSLLTYNGVTLPYSLTTDFRQEAVRDDSGTDRLYTRFDIACRGIINANYLPWLAPDLVQGGVAQTDNPAAIMEVVRHRLLQDRKALSFKVNDVELIPERQPNLIGTVDARNGPQPQRCVITQMSEASFFFDFYIVAHYWEKTSVDAARNPIARNEQANPVVSNRWSETVEIDNCNYSRRIREGKFVIRSDNREDKIIDAYRDQFAVLSIPAGFNRESARYTVGPDGLSLSYNVVDKEVFKQPPSPAFEADGEYIESTVNPGGSIRLGECRVSLKGSKTTDQSVLIEKAVQTCVILCRTRGIELQPQVIELRTTPGGAFTGFGISILKYAQVKRHLYRNEVEAMVRVQYKASKDRLTGLAGFAGMGTKTPFSDAERAVPQYRDRGTAFLLLQAAAYYDPSLLNTSQTNLGNAPEGSPVNETTPVGAGRRQTRLPAREVGTAGVRGEP